VTAAGKTSPRCSTWRLIAASQRSNASRLIRQPHPSSRRPRLRRLAWEMASGDGYPPVRTRARYAVDTRPPRWPAVLGDGYRGHPALVCSPGGSRSAARRRLGVARASRGRRTAARAAGAWCGGRDRRRISAEDPDCGRDGVRGTCYAVELLAVGFALARWAAAAGEACGSRRWPRVEAWSCSPGAAVIQHAAVAVRPRRMARSRSRHGRPQRDPGCTPSSGQHPSQARRGRTTNAAR